MRLVLIGYPKFKKTTSEMNMSIINKTLLKWQHAALIFLLLFTSCLKYDPVPLTPPGGERPSMVFDWEAIADSVQHATYQTYLATNGRYFKQQPNDDTFHYWWNAHMMDALLDGYQRTGEVLYLVRAQALLDGIFETNNGSFINNYYDDMGWLALASLRGYELSGDGRFRDAVDVLWNDIKTGVNDQHGGGVAWRKDQLSYKNTPATGPAIILGSRLFRDTDNIEYLETARSLYEWLKTTLVDPASGIVWDGVNRQGSGQIDKDWLFTYNQGLFVGAAYELYKTTGQVAFLQDAVHTANAAITSGSIAPGGILKDEGQGDGGLFKGVMVRYLTLLVQEEQVGSEDREKLLAFLAFNAETAYRSAVFRPALLFGPNWERQPEGDIDLSTQLSGLMLVEAVAYLEGLDLPSGEAGLEPEDDGIIRLLAIGNSFSEDAIENYLYDMALAADVPIVIANLYIGGSSLADHVGNVSENVAVYSYRKIDVNGHKTTTANVAVSEALKDERWTHISFQQVSQNSGQYDTWSASLPGLYAYVTARATHPEAKYVLHQTWAYSQNSTHAGFANYGNDQLTMYGAIVDAVNRARGLIDADLVVPAGTAIQNGRTSIIGDNFTRDGYHLDLGIGRYTAASTWFQALTGKSAVGNPYEPDGLSAFEIEVAQHAAGFAMKDPNNVTTMEDYQAWEGEANLEKSVFIDFGQTTPVDGWNGLSSPHAGTVIPNLRDMDGDYTNVTFTVVERFNNINTNGERQTNTDFNMPESVAANSYYGNTKAEFGGMIVEQSVVKLSGLDKNRSYDICYFASRSAVGDNREAKYTAKGANEEVALLDASNNKDDIACTNGITPDENGEITITFTAGDNNTNGTGFYYITAMRVAPAN